MRRPSKCVQFVNAGLRDLSYGRHWDQDRSENMTREVGGEMAEAAETETLGRLLDGLNSHLQPSLSPFVSETMHRHFGPDWLEHASRARGAPMGTLDLYANLKTILDKWH